MKRITLERRASGMCIRCGQPPRQGYKSCERCARKNRQYSSAWSMRNPEKRREGFRRFYQNNKDRQNAQRMERYRANLHQEKDVAFRTNLRRFYSMTESEYWTMFHQQDGACAICLTPPNGRKLGVDHNHQSRKIRGLLCSTCNSGIGAFRDDPDLMRRAARYAQHNAASVG